MTIVVMFAACLLSFMPQSAEEVIRQIENLEPPAIEESRLSNPKYVEEYYKKEAEYQKKRNELISLLASKYPEHERVLPLMLERWDGQINEAHMTQGGFDALIQDCQQIARQHPDLPLGKAAIDYILICRVEKAYAAEGIDYEKRLPEIRRLIDEHLKSHKATARLWVSYSRLAELTPGDAEKAKIYGQMSAIAEDEISRKGYAGMARRHEKMGQTFEMSFTDFTTGKKVTMSSLKGKVVLVDFWATWCAPCIQQLPHIKELYAKYKSQGFEVVGVSLDQSKAAGGDASLKQFLTRQPLPWPQYYQGNGPESDFSLSWGVLAIPTGFLIDREGKLRAVADTGEALEDQIKALL